MRLVATDLMSLYRPSQCSLRVYLKYVGEAEADPDPFQLVLRRLGIRHEQDHLRTLGTYVDLSEFPEEQRILETQRAMERKAPVIYQSAFNSETTLRNTNVTIAGRPDFLILHGNEYLIRDSKLSLRIDEENHPEIILQIQLYGWLFERSVGRPPSALQVQNGRGDLVQIPYDGGTASLASLETIVSLRQLAKEPYEPVGGTKCDGCAFQERCWKQAEERRDISLLMEVDQSLARVLFESGVRTPGDLLATYDVDALSSVKRPWGEKIQRVGLRANKIIALANAFETNLETVLSLPNIRDSSDYVMFDLEGMPPYLDELDKIYLWGMQVFGQKPTEYMPSCAEFGGDGEKKAWEAFLRNAQRIFDQYGDIPFVHWSPYEKTYLRKYVDRFGDVSGVSGRILTNLLDLYPVTKNAVLLPVHSYGLKVIERYVGFNRTQEERGGAWSMAMFIEATETENEQARSEVMNEILKYNKEDLAATWAVLQWLKSRTLGARAAQS
jgi:predicted RecB family nuclease